MKMAAHDRRNFRRFGMGDATADITALYVREFGRQPDAAGLAYWTEVLSKSNLQDVTAAFEASPEHQAYLAAHAQQSGGTGGGSTGSTGTSSGSILPGIPNMLLFAGGAALAAFVVLKKH